MTNTFEPNALYPFDKITIKIPKALQGGTYNAKLEINDEPIIIQTPKCRTKHGIHITAKQIYCDLLMTADDESFIEWLTQLQEKVRHLILENAENWFHEVPTLDEIEYNWNDSMRTYKNTNYLIRTFVKKNKSMNKITLQIFDTEENQLGVNDIKPETEVICILEIMGLKFSSQSFHLDICLRQIMLIKKKPLFDKCLIKRDKDIYLDNTIKNDMVSKDMKEKDDKMTMSTNMNDEKNIEKVKTNVHDHKDNSNEVTNNLIDNITKNDTSVRENKTTNINNNTEVVANVSDKTEVEAKEEIANVSDKTENETAKELDKTEDETAKELDKTENETIEKIENTKDKKDAEDNNIEKFKILKDETTNNPKSLENLNNLEEIDLKIESSEPITLKKPSDVYLNIYKAARIKAKKAKMEAIKAYLEAKRIKELYLLDVADSTDEESDSYDEEIFSEN
tara:strand:+ start:57 stop:1412 length:1356 start_codon:yes stop_codon:yes gene_type:complete